VKNGRITKSVKPLVFQSALERVRERLVQEGLELALNRAKPTRVRNRVVDGENEAYLIALDCLEAPDGLALDVTLAWTTHCSWLMESVSHKTFRQMLKKGIKALAK
jgi:hypothetical protein